MYAGCAGVASAVAGDASTRRKDIAEVSIYVALSLENRHLRPALCDRSLDRLAQRFHLLFAFSNSRSPSRITASAERSGLQQRSIR
jgi:hypothetical protein